jgi:hypothetical protein
MHRITAILFVFLLTACRSDFHSFDSDTGTDDTMDDTGTDTSGDDSTDGTGSDMGSMDMGTMPDMGNDPVDLPDPLAWYIFNGNANDQIGDADGVEVWATVPYVPGYDGLAAQFGVDTGHFDLSASLGETYAALVNASAFSVAARVRTDEYVGTYNLVSLRNKGETITSNALLIQVSEGYWRVYSETGAGVDHLVNVADVPSLGDWHDVVFVFDGTDIRMYSDGVAVGETAYVPAETMATLLKVGASVDHELPWRGALDDLRIYDRVLTEDEALLLSEPGD